jgi:hypothetical protein
MGRTEKPNLKGATPVQRWKVATFQAELKQDKVGRARAKRPAKLKAGPIIATPEQCAAAEEFISLLHSEAEQSDWVDFYTGKPLP